MCSVEGCETEGYSRGWCKKHYTRWLRHGDPLITRALRGSGKARQYQQRSAHLRVQYPDHPLADSRGSVLVHRMVAWDAGILTSVNLHLIVHHLDEDPTNNDPSNLAAVTRSEHTRIHKEGKGSQGQCSECDARAVARGMCRRHYSTWWARQRRGR